MKLGLSRLDLKLKNCCAQPWGTNILWRYNSNMSRTCTTNRKANFSSSSKCYMPFSGMANCSDWLIVVSKLNTTDVLSVPTKALADVLLQWGLYCAPV